MALSAFPESTALTTEEALYEQNYFVQRSRFDWFCAGVDADITLFAQLFVQRFECDVEHVAPRNGYRYAIRFVLGSRVLCTCMYGGDNVGARLYVLGTGYESGPLRDFLVANYPNSVLIRADVCLDIDEPDSFRLLYRLLVSVAQKYKLNTNSVGDWVNEINGRTFYIGSRQSPAYCRLYEKGKQLLSGSADHSRLEVECKPKNTQARLHWFSQNPCEFWSFNSWTSNLFTSLAGIGISQSSVKSGVVYRESSHDRAMHYLIRQYRATIQNELSYNGGDYLSLIARLIGANDLDDKD